MSFKKYSFLIFVSKILKVNWKHLFRFQGGQGNLYHIFAVNLLQKKIVLVFCFVFLMYSDHEIPLAFQTWKSLWRKESFWIAKSSENMTEHFFSLFLFLCPSPLPYPTSNDFITYRKPNFHYQIRDLIQCWVNFICQLSLVLLKNLQKLLRTVIFVSTMWIKTLVLRKLSTFSPIFLLYRLDTLTSYFF